MSEALIFASTFLILYPPFENSTTRIAILLHNIWEKVNLILAGNLNSARSYLITAVLKMQFIYILSHLKKVTLSLQTQVLHPKISSCHVLFAILQVCNSVETISTKSFYKRIPI